MTEKRTERKQRWVGQRDGAVALRGGGAVVAHLVPGQGPAHSMHHGCALQRRVQAGQLSGAAGHLALPELRVPGVVPAPAATSHTARRRRPPPLGAEEAQIGLAVLRGDC